jgi:hypothetical protein
MLVAVLGIALFSSVGLGAILDVDGNINPAHYDTVVVDIGDPAGADFAGSGSDIEAVYWGLATGPDILTDPTDVWYTLGMTVAAPPINTTGDGTSPFPAPTSVRLGLSQGGTNLYMIDATMYFGNVINVIMLDLSTPTPTPITLDPTTLKYKVDSGLEMAIRANQFLNLSPATFDFDLLFEGGGEDRDDRIAGSIPEPATMSMLMIGGLVALARRRKRRDA